MQHGRKNWSQIIGFIAAHTWIGKIWVLWIPEIKGLQRPSRLPSSSKNHKTGTEKLRGLSRTAQQETGRFKTRNQPTDTVLCSGKHLSSLFYSFVSLLNYFMLRVHNSEIQSWKCWVCIHKHHNPQKMREDSAWHLGIPFTWCYSSGFRAFLSACPDILCCVDVRVIIRHWRD